MTSRSRNVTVDELMEDLNDYVHDGSVNRKWVRRAIEFLDAADLAEEDDEGYTIRYMGIVKDTSESTFQEGVDELGHTKELAHRLIRRYCDNVGVRDSRPEEDGESDEETTDSYEQASFQDFN